jgi:hypothetical protein
MYDHKITQDIVISFAEMDVDVDIGSSLSNLAFFYILLSDLMPCPILLKMYRSEPCIRRAT